MDTNNVHIEDEDLESYSTCHLSKESVALVEQHLLICGTCQQRLVEAEEYLTAIKGATRRLPWVERAGNRWSWSFPRLIPVFAALASITVAVVVLPVIRHGSPAAPVAVSLQAMRGSETQTTAPSRRPMLLELDLTGLAASPSYRVEIVDRAGDRVWQGACKSSGATASVAVPAQKRGTYFVRVALPSGETLREFGLVLRGTD